MSTIKNDCTTYVSFERAAGLVGCGVTDVVSGVSCGRIPFRFAGKDRLVAVEDVANYCRARGIAA